MNKKKNNFSIFSIINALILSCVIIITIYPFLFLISTSVSTASEIIAGKVTFYPHGVHFAAFRSLLREALFWNGYKNTVIYTISGTFASIALTTICAYCLSHKQLPGSKIMTIFCVMTMFITGGMVPTYLVVKTLGLTDTIWAIILPNAIDAYYMIIMRTYFRSIPASLEEAAMIDGMGPTRILFKIFLPLSKPTIATISMFYAVSKWNMWFKPLLYLNKPELFPISLFLRNIVFAEQISLVDVGSAADAAQIYMTMKPAAIILVTLPIILVYPFAQRYFVSGVMLGSIKE